MEQRDLALMQQHESSDCSFSTSRGPVTSDKNNYTACSASPQLNQQNNVSSFVNSPQSTVSYAQKQAILDPVVLQRYVLARRVSMRKNALAKLLETLLGNKNLYGGIVAVDSASPSNLGLLSVAYRGDGHFLRHPFNGVSLSSAAADSLYCAPNSGLSIPDMHDIQYQTSIPGINPGIKGPRNSPVHFLAGNIVTEKRDLSLSASFSAASGQFRKASSPFSLPHSNSSTPFPANDALIEEHSELESVNSANLEVTHVHKEDSLIWCQQQIHAAKLLESNRRNLGTENSLKNPMLFHELVLANTAPTSGNLFPAPCDSRNFDIIQPPDELGEILVVMSAATKVYIAELIAMAQYIEQSENQRQKAFTSKENEKKVFIKALAKITDRKHVEKRTSSSKKERVILQKYISEAAHRLKLD